MTWKTIFSQFFVLSENVFHNVLAYVIIVVGCFVLFENNCHGFSFLKKIYRAYSKT